MPPRIPIETSARHIHITKEDFEALFGEGKEDGRPVAAIIREKGSNSDREMAWAL